MGAHYWKEAGIGAIICVDTLDVKQAIVPMDADIELSVSHYKLKLYTFVKNWILPLNLGHS